LWDAATWKVTGEFRGPRARVMVLTFGPDGQLFSGSLDTTVMAWDVRKAKRPPADRP
jgi:WD40 repeat protein